MHQVTQMSYAYVMTSRTSNTLPQRARIIDFNVVSFILIESIVFEIFESMQTSPVFLHTTCSISITMSNRNATALGSLIRPRTVTRCNLAVSDMYMRDFGKTHQIAYTYCSVGISDLKPLTGTSADQLPHRKSRSLATA